MRNKKKKRKSENVIRQKMDERLDELLMARKWPETFSLLMNWLTG